MRNDVIYCNYLLSPVGLVRGYAFMDRVEGLSLKRKSPFTIIDAVQTNDTISHMEVGTTTGERNDTSLFYNEKVEDITYLTKGVFDLCRLKFISADPICDRLAIKDDWISTDLVNKSFKKHYGNIASPKYGHFTYVNRAKYVDKCYSEYGILLNDELVEYLVKRTLKNMLNMNIRKNNAFAYTSKLQVKLVDDITSMEQTMNSSKGWINIITMDDIDSLNLTNIEEFYVEGSDSDFKVREEMEKKYKEDLANSKKNKNGKKAKDISTTE
jgi:hypothetical protein